LFIFNTHTQQTNNSNHLPLPFTAKTTSSAVQLGLVGLLSRPVIKTFFPSEKKVSTQDTPTSTEKDNTPLSTIPSATPSSPTQSGAPVLPPISATAFNQTDFPQEHFQQPQQEQQEELPKSLPPSEPIVPENAESQVPAIYTNTMATTQDTHYVGQDESELITKTENMNLAEQGQADEAHGLSNGLTNGEQEHANYAAPYDESIAHPQTIGRESPNSEYPQSEARPSYVICFFLSIRADQQDEQPSISILHGSPDPHRHHLRARA
jgi:hypothetical protein